MYNQKIGLSIGFGYSYWHGGLFKKEVNQVYGKNDLIKPIIVYELRYKTSNDVIIALNMMWRIKKEDSFSYSIPSVSPFMEYETITESYIEDGMILQLKFFKGM